MERVTVISSHPDDETLGAGGTILRYKDGKNKIFWINLTDIKKEYGYTDSGVKNRTRQIEAVRILYKIDGFYNFGLRPASMDSYPKSALIKKISDIFLKIKPTVVILPFKNDIHSDHRVAFEVAYAATKVFRIKSIKEILMMEVLSETDFASSDEGFTPNYFVDVSDYFKEKINIMKVYKSEIKASPFPRSLKNIESLATYRGATAGCKYAEAFVLLKKIF